RGSLGSVTSSRLELARNLAQCPGGDDVFWSETSRGIRYGFLHAAGSVVDDSQSNSVLGASRLHWTYACEEHQGCGSQFRWSQHRQTRPALNSRLESTTNSYQASHTVSIYRWYCASWHLQNVPAFITESRPYTPLKRR